MPVPEVQIALANLEVMSGEQVLLVGFPGPELPEGLQDKGASVTVFHQNLRGQRTWPGAIFGDWLETDIRFDVIAITLPKERGRLDLQLAMATPLLKPGGYALLAGHNDAGIKSAGKHLIAALGASEVVDYRFHSRLLRAARTGDVPASSIDRWRIESHIAVSERPITLMSYPGVFAHRALDDGTKMLLEAFAPPSGARVLDVGCGSGAVTAWAAMAGASVDAVDVDALALRATTETIEANALQARVFPSDVYSDIVEQYSHILCNPPFHAGIRTSSGMAMRLIEEAPARLIRGGELWIVANRFLDYLEPIRRTFGHVEIVREDSRFRVYRAK